MLTNTITKKLLENIVHETFLKFGSISCSSLLDSLKLLGFSYATSAGISINIEDLKTPNSKKNFIGKANAEIKQVSKEWQEGILSDTERFQTIIDSWNIATESLKNRIIDYYQNYDPTNNLYIMAFSGARGNMSQVRQLVGMRGLMSDQEGKIIDLPIQANFREGLSSIDYIISSYGARKGIVDTALKTADSGYLTRRLIYIAQDLVIRQKNCGTKKGILIFLEQKTNSKNLIGRFLISRKSIGLENESFIDENTMLTSDRILDLKKMSPLLLNIRSSLTCILNGSICQNCYGWDLAQGKKIALGEAVGIIAAQSIGEPGTQLTMRTFHTGGIFTGELLTQIQAPFSGKLIFPSSVKSIPYRTSHGVLVQKLQQEISILLINWEGKTKEIFLNIDSFLYENSFSFVKKGQLIAEFMNQSILPGPRKLKPILSPLSGEVRFENLLVRKMFREKRTIKVNEDDGILWISSGKILLLPKEVDYHFSSILSEEKPFASLNFSFPFQGIIKFSQKKIIIYNQNKKFLFDLNEFKMEIKNAFIKIFLYPKNYQYVDSFTLLGTLNFFSKFKGKIYLVRKKDSKYKSTFFFITENDIWKVNCDQVNDFSFYQEKKGMIRAGSFLNSNSKIQNAGFFLKKDGFQMIFQLASPIFLSRGTILNYKQGDFILEKKVIANLVNYTQQTEDIVQGLPKIEELIEARKPKIKSYLASRPGVFSASLEFNEKQRYIIESSFKDGIIFFTHSEKNEKLLEKKGKNEKQSLSIIHSFFSKDPLIIFQNRIFQFSYVPSIFHLTKKSTGKKEQYFLGNSFGDGLLIKGKSILSSWTKIKGFKSLIKEEEKNILYSLQNNELSIWDYLNENQFIYKNKKEDLIVFTKGKGMIYLECLSPLFEYRLPLTAKPVFSPGNFIDIGEPFTEGIIDIEELLHIFFEYHSTFDGIMAGCLKSLQKFQLLLVNSIQSIYQSQGVNISSKHIEIIVRQMTSKVVIKESGDSPFLPGEMIRFSLVYHIYESLKKGETGIPFQIPKFEPLLLSSTNASLTKDGFLSSAGFQETKRVLTKAAIEGSVDWLRALKECIIIGRITPAGSAFLNYKNYLDNVYLFKS